MNDAKRVDEGERAGGESFVPVGQLIARRLREAILSEDLAPGTRIRQAPVAAEYGTSRIPVREALAQLESEGLVTLTPHSGARVARFDLGEHVELYRIRELLEPLAVRESAQLLSDDEIAELRRKAERIERSAGEPAAYLLADREFHLATYAAAPMTRLLEMIDSLWNQTTHYRRTYLRLVREADRDVDLGYLEHRLLLDSLARRDPEAAAELVRMHLRRTRVRITEHAATITGSGQLG